MCQLGQWQACGCQSTTVWYPCQSKFWLCQILPDKSYSRRILFLSSAAHVGCSEGGEWVYEGWQISYQFEELLQFSCCPGCQHLVDCTDLFGVRMSSIGIINTSKNTTEVCLTAHLPLLKTDPHSWVTLMNLWTIVMFPLILSMNNYIVCNANHSNTVGEDLVHHPLEECLVHRLGSRGGRQIWAFPNVCWR